MWWHCLVDEYTPVLIEKNINALGDKVLKIQVAKHSIVLEHIHHCLRWLHAAVLYIPLYQ